MRTKKADEDGRTSKWSKISILIILHKLFCRKFVQNLFKTNVNEHNTLKGKHIYNNYEPGIQAKAETDNLVDKTAMTTNRKYNGHVSTGHGFGWLYIDSHPKPPILVVNSFAIEPNASTMYIAKNVYPRVCSTLCSPRQSTVTNRACLCADGSVCLCVWVRERVCVCLGNIECSSLSLSLSLGKHPNKTTPKTFASFTLSHGKGQYYL